MCRPALRIVICCAAATCAAGMVRGTAVVADQPAAPAPAPATGAERVMTPEGVREPPVFSRFDTETWEKLLQKGKALLEDVKDNTFGYDEEAFYWLTYQVCRMDPTLLEPDAECQPYRALLAMPSSFRGHLVTIRGVYMSAVQFRVPVVALQKETPHLFECTIKEPPFDQLRPVATVVVKENPMLNFRVGDDVRVKGYFYKVRRYEGTRGEGFAPMIIAQRLVTDTGQARFLDEPPAAGGAWSDPYLVLMVALVMVLMIAFVAIRMMLRKPSSHAPGQRPFQVHKFRLRRPDRAEPLAGGGSGGQGGGQKP